MKKKEDRKIKRRRITFRYESRTARQVHLVGDFNGWNERKHPMVNDGDGLWKKNIVLAPGTYEYKFIVDGEWEKDPANQEVRFNTYGTSNSVLNVAPK